MVIDDCLDLVSYHAVARYVERVLLVAVPPEIVALPSKERAERSVALAGLTVEAVRRQILNPAVMTAIINKMSRVGCALFEARLGPAQQGGGRHIVITINVGNLSLDKKRRGRAIKHQSRNETRREAHKNRRRHKRATG